MKRIYLDHAAATPLDPQVKEVMLPWLEEHFGNPSSLHKEGKEAREAIDSARKQIAGLLGAMPEELVFTGSGTESCNLAILGAARKQAAKGKKHVITTPVEHHAVLNAMKKLEEEGFEITYAPVDQFGMVDAKEVMQLVRKDTALVSVIFANNEIGTINPIKQIVRAVKKANPDTLVHSDACQATGSVELHFQKLGLDLLTINAAKIYGPKGIGALLVKRGVELEPIVYGGGQEQGLRSGTENVAAIIGFAKALEIAIEKCDEENTRLVNLRDNFIRDLGHELEGIELQGHPSDRLPNNVNITVEGLEGEVLVVYLDQKGIACSTSAACTTVTTEPSHVLLALGKTEKEAKSPLRFTLGRSTMEEDLKTVVKTLKETVKKLRS